jgi:hypothetical protein
MIFIGSKRAGGQLQAVKSAMLILNDCVNPKQLSPALAYANNVQLGDIPGCVGAAAVLLMVGRTPTGPWPPRFWLDASVLVPLIGGGRVYPPPGGLV